MSLGSSPQASVPYPLVRENPHTIVMHPWVVKLVREHKLDPRDVIEGIVFGDSKRYITSEQGKLEVCTLTHHACPTSAHAPHRAVPYLATDPNPPPTIMVKRIGER